MFSGKFRSPTLLYVVKEPYITASSPNPSHEAKQKQNELEQQALDAAAKERVKQEKQRELSAAIKRANEPKDGAHVAVPGFGDVFIKDTPFSKDKKSGGDQGGNPPDGGIDW